jgi:hypothetical protein
MAGMRYPKATGSVKQRVQKDQRYDRASGIKEDSKADKKMDRKMGISQAAERKYGGGKKGK